MWFTNLFLEDIFGSAYHDSWLHKGRVTDSDTKCEATYFSPESCVQILIDNSVESYTEQPEGDVNFQVGDEALALLDQDIVEYDWEGGEEEGAEKAEDTQTDKEEHTDEGRSKVNEDQRPKHKDTEVEKIR